VCAPGNTPPPCGPVAQPKRANLTEKTVQGQEVIITLDKGTAAGVNKGWTGVILVGNSNNPLPGSSFVIFKVTEDESQGKIRKFSLDEIGENYKVLLTPPPANP
jgi:hypothetical protein